MGFISYIISLIVVGLVVGGLGRLVVPGRNSIGLAATVGIGLVGSIVGAIIGDILGLGVLSILPEVAVSAGLVVASSRGGSGRQLTS